MPDHRTVPLEVRVTLSMEGAPRRSGETVRGEGFVLAERAPPVSQFRGRCAWALCAFAVSASGCGASVSGVPAGGGDAGPADGGAPDTGPADGGPPDAGPLDGGPRDGGTEPAAGACEAASDCGGARASVRWCGAAGMSCIGRACLWECSGGRTCELADGGCVACAPDAGPACEATGCAWRTVETFGVEEATCALFPGTNQPFAGSNLTITRLGGPGACSYQAHLAASPYELGDFVELERGGFLAQFPGLGGTCTGEGLATALERLVFSCPDCQFVLAR